MPLAFLLLPILGPALAIDRDGAHLRAESAAIVDLFYGHDFDRAAPAADALAKRHPGHPVGPLFQAIVAYQRWLAEGMLENAAWDAIDVKLSSAVAAAQALEASAPAESHYYRGAALGFRARGLAGKRHFIRALPDAAASVRQLRMALDLDPTLQDARLGLGMYHYFAARMPRAAKPLASMLVGEPPDREKGLAELWEVARSTGIARMEARAVLAMILSKEDEANWNGAEELLKELMSRYPRNPLYRLRRVYVSERRGEWSQAQSLADPEGAWLRGLHPSLQDNARIWARYRLAEIYILEGRSSDARNLLLSIDETKAPKNLRPWIRRRRAEASSGLKNRDVAPYFSGY